MVDEAPTIKLGQVSFRFEGDFLAAYIDLEEEHLLIGTIAKGAVGRYKELEKGFVELMSSLVTAFFAEKGITLEFFRPDGGGGS